MVNMSDSTKNKSIWQFIKFAIVGLSNTIISEAIYVILIYFRMHYVPASFIGFSISTINAFYWNHKYVFSESTHALSAPEAKTPILRLFLRTYLAYLGSYLLSALLLFFWIDVLHIANKMTPFSHFFKSHGFPGFDNTFLGEALAAFLNLLITVPLNFLANKYWAFRSTSNNKIK